MGSSAAITAPKAARRFASNSPQSSPCSRSGKQLRPYGPKPRRDEYSGHRNGKAFSPFWGISGGRPHGPSRGRGPILRVSGAPRGGQVHHKQNAHGVARAEFRPDAFAGPPFLNQYARGQA